MGDWEEQLNTILGDPRQMERIAGLARSLMGGGDDAPPPPGEAGPDPGLLRMLGRAMNTGGENSREQALLAAMKPYLSEKRRGKIDRAMKLARLARIAGLALGEAGGGHDQSL